MVNTISHENDKEPNGELKDKENNLLFLINESPKWHLAFLLGFQHYLTMFGATVGLPYILGNFLCFADKTDVMNEVLGTIFFCSGITTLIQTSLGVRLPIVQGGTYGFVAPTAAIMALKPPCSSPINTQINNATSIQMNIDTTSTTGEEEWKIRMREIQGAIIVSSVFQILLGFSGAVGYIMKFIGPLTVVPTIALVGLPLFATAGNLAGAHWGVAFATMVCIGLFSQVLKDVKVPLGCARVQLFKLFPVLFAIVICWTLSAILTVADVVGTSARTDTKIDILYTSKWFRIPYPCQWGAPTVTVAAVFGMLAGVMSSIIESVGDYYACARLAGAPTPPKHAMNRGIAAEGLGCMLTGVFGTGNGTTSISENIGAIGITRVGSVRVVQCGAIVMILLSVVSKFGAVFVTIPDPVVGGIFIIMFGMITAIGLSNLQYVDLNSMRNLFVLGTSLFFGMTLPSWISANPSKVDLGNETINQILQVLLTTNMAVGGFTGFFLDNVLPGSREERGLVGWLDNSKAENFTNSNRIASIHVYDPPFLTQKFLSSKFAKYCPFLPYYQETSPPASYDGEITAL